MQNEELPTWSLLTAHENDLISILSALDHIQPYFDIGNSETKVTVKS